MKSLPTIIIAFSFAFFMQQSAPGGLVTSLAGEGGATNLCAFGVRPNGKGVRRKPTVAFPINQLKPYEHANFSSRPKECLAKATPSPNRSEMASDFPVVEHYDLRTGRSDRREQVPI